MLSARTLEGTERGGGLPGSGVWADGSGSGSGMWGDCGARACAEGAAAAGGVRGGSTAAGAGGLDREAEGTEDAVQGVRTFGHLDTSETTNYSHPKMAS